MGTHIYANGEMHEVAHMRTGTHTHMGESRVSRDTCMGSPYAYGQRKIAHTRMGCPYAYGPAHTRMGKILVWDGTTTTTDKRLPVQRGSDNSLIA